jgi:Zn-dependent protease with chaperone function
MSRPQIEAVLGHEISHVANGDMVTLALLQGVLKTLLPQSHRRPTSVLRQQPQELR